MSTQPMLDHRDKRQKLVVPYPYGDPLASEADYDKIDRNINNGRAVQRWRQRYPEDFDESFCDYLLLAIVKGSEDHLDPQYKDLSAVERLLEEEKGLTQELLTAWKSGTFKSILALDCLQRRTIFPSASHETDKTMTSVMEESNMKNIQKTIKDAWVVSYMGGYHRNLLARINEMKQNDPYMNICAIVQSSGTGKSRMVDEQAKLVYTLPINLRSGKGTKFTYPPSDQQLHAFFVNTSGSVDDCKKRYTIFFSCLFVHAAERLVGLTKNSRQSREDFAAEWYSHMNDWEYRKTFYDEVVELCESTVMGHGLATVVKKAQSNLSALILETNKYARKTHSIKIMIYIDEAHELKNVRLLDHKNRTQFDVLCSTIAAFSEHSLFCLLLSTQSSLPFLAPPGEASTSERARQKAGSLLAPLTETPFDCAPDIKISPGKLHLKDLAEVTFIAKWGRPLWWSIAKEANTWTDHQDIIKFAQMKLLRSHDVHAPLSKVSAAAQLAVLDVLLAFEFEPSRQGTYEAEDEMVTNHMRIIYSIPKHRRYFRSGYPSEPLLAEAAAQQVYRFQLEHGPGSVMAWMLQDWGKNSLIDLGQRGEVVMRLLLMQAYMDSVRVEYASTSSQDTSFDDSDISMCIDDASESTMCTDDAPESTDAPPGSTPTTVPPGQSTTTFEAQRLIFFSQGCHLVTFIEQLFSPGPASEILDSIPDNIILDTTFRVAFRNSVVRFTHFVKAGDSSVLTTEALFAAFVRGVAFICHQTQRYVDLAIPVLLDKSNALQESAMSAILIQVKRHVHTRNGGAYTFRQEEVGLFPQSDKFSGRPYITLVAELGGPQPGESGTPKEVYISEQPRVQRHACGTHPRFAATVYGCTNKLYRAAGERRGDIEMLLATQDFLKEHPRQDKASLSSVMKLKPFWKYGEDTYHWLESGALNKRL